MENIAARNRPLQFLSPSKITGTNKPLRSRDFQLFGSMLFNQESIHTLFVYALNDLYWNNLKEAHYYVYEETMMTIITFKTTKLQITQPSSPNNLILQFMITL